MSARQRLVDAWAQLEAGGHTVRRVDPDSLDDHELGALATDAEHRLRAIAEGEAAGVTTTRRCTKCSETKPIKGMSWRRGWCKACEAARVRGYLDRQRAELGNDEFKRRRAEAHRARRQRSRRTS